MRGGNLAFRKNKITVEAAENTVELPSDWQTFLFTISDTPSFILKSVNANSHMADTIRQIRAYSGLGLKESKALYDLVKAGTEQEVTPKTGLTKDEADAVFMALDDYGAEYSKIGIGLDEYSVTTITFSKASVPEDAKAMGSDGLYYTFDATTGALVFYASNSKIINAPKDSSNLFYGLSEIRNIDFSNFSTVGVVNMQEMFSFFGGMDWVDNGTGAMESKNFPDKLDLSNFDTSNVTNMENMFMNCNASSILVSSFDTSKVTNMRSMFAYCSFLTSLDLSNFNTSKVTDMNAMFAGAKISVLNICNFNFDNVTDISNMLGYEMSPGMVGMETIINEIVLPAFSTDISINLYPTDGCHYALEEVQTNSISILDSSINAKGKTLKLYYDNTNLEVPLVNSFPTDNTGVVADVLSIFIVLICLFGIAVIFIRPRKHYAK